MPVWLGIFNTCPTVKILLVKLLALFNSSTVTPYVLATPYNVSPNFTVYVPSCFGSSILSDDGNNNCLPTVNKSLIKPFNLLISLTVVLYLLAIPYKLSPL